MPAGQQHLATGLDNGYHAMSAQKQQQAHSSHGQLASVGPMRRIGLQQADDLNTHHNVTGQTYNVKPIVSAKQDRDLGNLIDSMPPLSIELETKRLILAKKLDRESIDRYMQATGYQSSLSGSVTQSSSASLTVHVKCQLRSRKPVEGDQNSTNPKSTRRMSKESELNSILIPVHLIVTDENDNWPVFINSPYIVDMNESVQVGTLLSGNEILAVDGDQQGPLSTIEYSIVPGSFWSDSFAFLNPLDSRSLIVKNNRNLDFETQSKLTLKVMARDQGEPPNWAISSLHINLLDSDDSSPIFGEDKYFGYIKSNRPGEIIDLMPKRLTARDGDRMINSPIVYAFQTKTNHSIYFDLDPDVGKLSLRKSFPDESSNKQPFCLLIRATQVDNPHRWTLTMINMRFARIVAPESSPQLERIMSMTESSDLSSMSPTSNGPSIKFSHTNYTVEISETAPPGFTVIQPRISLNSVHPNELSYHLLDDDLGYFRLDERSGRLSLNRSIDYEMHRHLSIRILASYEYYDEQILSRQANIDQSKVSNQYPKLVCDITRVNINVNNHNDFAPEFSHEQYNFQLAISDLIANYGSLKAIDENLDTTTVSRTPTKRFGNVEIDETSDDNLDNLAMQLGHIFCADRDFGDKVNLQLVGSKAGLFHLTQDGRLYLPLVNMSDSTSQSGVLASRRTSSDFSTWSYPKATKVPRIFARSRSDQSSDSIDRRYLNHLLGEFSNLGRLRLKVLATDDGHPETLQSTAIVVITIISIDNFILQRASPSTNYSNATGLDVDKTAIQLNNQTTYETGRSDMIGGGGSQLHNHLMVIPAANGKSFVHINPDIISNLVLPGVNRQNGTYVTENKNSTDIRSGQPNNSEVLDTASSHTGAAMASEPLGSSHSRFNPPSLLVVDENGAKFVAMNAAIDVYNRQVKKAIDQENVRQRVDAEVARRAKSDNFIVGWWKGSAGSDDELNSINWLNLSTIVTLILIALLVVVGIVYKLKSSYDNSFNSGSLASRLSTFLFPRRGLSSDRSMVNILENTSQAHHLGGYVDRSDNPDLSRFGFQDQAGTHVRKFSSNLNPTRAIDCSSGARRNILTSASEGSFLSNKSSQTKSQPEPEDGDKQQQLFDHLKLTLDKMVDSKGSARVCKGELAIKATESDIVALDKTSQRAETILEIKHDQSKKSVVDFNKSSTFTGCLSKVTTPPDANEQAYTTTTIVPIGKTATKSVVSLRLKKGDTILKTRGSENSSNSSVQSSFSSSSSISDKIHAAIEHTRDISCSDASSLDSAALFNPLQTNWSAQPSAISKTTRVTAPPPPPPPPPPPLPLPSKTCREDRSNRPGIGKQLETKNRLQSRPFSASISDSDSSISSRPIPQNPLHVKLRQQVVTPPQQVSPSCESKIAQTLAMRMKAEREPDSQRNLSAPPSQPVKTVSPTTSVDRGYESLQSYSSSQAHQKQTTDTKVSCSFGAPDLSSPVDRANSKKNLYSLSKSTIPPPPAAISVGQKMTNIDQTSSKNNSSVTNIPRKELDCISFKDRDRVVEEQFQNNEKRGSEQSRGKRAYQAENSRSSSVLDSNRNIYNCTGVPNKSQQSRIPSDHLNTRSSRHNTKQTSRPDNLPRGHLVNPVRHNNSYHYQLDNKPPDDGDTEDDDFYYSSTQRNRVSCIDSRQDKIVDTVLEDYVNHAYQPRKSMETGSGGGGGSNSSGSSISSHCAGGKHTQSGPYSSRFNGSRGQIEHMSMSKVRSEDSHGLITCHKSECLTEYEPNTAQLRHLNRSVNQRQKHLNNRHLNQQLVDTGYTLNGHGNGSKKQLTWSDQVKGVT